MAKLDVNVGAEFPVDEAKPKEQQDGSSDCRGSREAWREHKRRWREEWRARHRGFRDEFRGWADDDDFGAYGFAGHDRHFVLVLGVVAFAALLYVIASHIWIVAAIAVAVFVLLAWGRAHRTYHALEQ